MALNETVVTLTDNTPETLIAVIVELTGWHSSGSDIFADTDEHYRITIQSSSTAAAHKVGIYFDDKIIGTAKDITVTKVAYHGSKNGKVQYVELVAGTNEATRIIYALNSEGKGTLITGYYQSAAVYFAYGTVGMSEYKKIQLMTTSNETGYAGSKMPDMENGSEFPELYYMMTVRSPEQRNQLVKFAGDNTVYRVVPIYGTSLSAAKIWLAFPVSD